MTLRFTLILLLISSAYLVLSFIVFSGALRLKRGTNRRKLRVSVVVPVRNEADYIGPCLNALLRQTYPSEYYEVIVVDDGSTDGTSQILESYKNRYPRLQILQASQAFSGITGKQNALARGVRSSSGEVILHTDADCMVPSTWIEEVVSYFEDDVGLVTGFALPPRSRRALGIFDAIRSADQLLLQTVAAGCIGWGRPLSCSAKNIAYRRSAYESIRGFEHMGFQPNDDMALLQRLHRNTSWRTIFMKRGTPVRIHRRMDVIDFLRQRRRWMLGGFRSHPLLFLLLGFVFWTHLMTLISALFAGVLPSSLMMYSWLLIGSGIFVLLGQGASMTRRPDLMLAFPLFEVFYVVYTVVLGFVALSPLRKEIRWKGRTYTQRI